MIALHLTFAPSHPERVRVFEEHQDTKLGLVWFMSDLRIPDKILILSKDQLTCDERELLLLPGSDEFA